ncbi:hypothetical protein DCC61_01485 [Candidatus Microgenomates bacterium]|nr:MAG: hypothetical protein DCC61_01485 [Candidatus Microgenomates bacterium]
MTERGGSDLPILDRIMTAGQTLGVSRREISNEISRLASENDIAGMQTLFNAYKNWELREREASVSEEVTEELAYRNFDVVARVADGLEEGDEDLVAMAKAVRRGQGIGKITKFYRNAVSYEPPKQRTDNFYDN